MATGHLHCAVYVQCLVYEDIGVCGTCGIYVVMTAARRADCCGAIAEGRRDRCGQCRMSGSGQRREAVTGFAGGAPRSDGCRQIGTAGPGRCPAGSGGIATRHAGTVAVDVGADARGSCIRWSQDAIFGGQGTPGKVGGAVHMGSSRQGNRAMAGGAGEGAGQPVGCCCVRGMGTDFSISVDSYLGRVRCVVERDTSRDRPGRGTAVALAALIGG